MSILTVINTRTGDQMQFVEADDLTPAQAAINAYESGRKNFNTWTWAKAPNHPAFQEVEDGFTCGPWFCPKDGQIVWAYIPNEYWQYGDPVVCDYGDKVGEGLGYQIGGETLAEAQATFGEEESGWRIVSLLHPGIIHTWDNAGRVLFVDLEQRTFAALLFGRKP